MKARILNHMSEIVRTEMSKWIREHFMVDDLSPEEYAGRFSEGLLCMGFRLSEHRDSELEEWLAELREILDDGERLATLRQRYLSPDE